VVLYTRQKFTSRRNALGSTAATRCVVSSYGLVAQST
jgi:hypothetical protein